MNSDNEAKRRFHPALRSLVSAAVLAAAAAGLSSAPALAADWHRPAVDHRVDDWRRHEWRVHHEYRPYAYVAPGYGYPGYGYYAPPPVVYGVPGLTVRVPLVIR